MTDNLILFTSQFLLVFLLGVQSLNIVRGYYVLAAITSLLLGVAGWFTVGIISSASTYDLTSTTFLSYIVAGPVAIVCAMKAHELIRKTRL